MANFFVAGNVDSVMADPTLNKRCLNAHQPEAVCEDFPLTYCHFAECVDTAIEP